MPTSENVSQQPAVGSSHLAFSPYRTFSREEWAKLRADTPMTLVGCASWWLRPELSSRALVERIQGAMLIK